jgi:uncharacterized membrane protein
MTAAVPALCSDGRRAVIATAVAVVVPLAVGVATPAGDGVARDVVLALVGWNLFVVIYVVLTWRTFGSRDPQEFACRMRARRDLRPRAMRRLTPGGDGPTFAVQSAAVAFAVVLVLPHIRGIEVDDLLLVPITLSILFSSWGLAVVSYALHYAQHDADAPGLEFPGTRANTFADYRYFAVAVATTFGATDVNITTPRMRRIVNAHTLLTFVYNSVIVALLASFLTH